MLLLDLRNAYLQIHFDKALWPFQTVIFRGQCFCLTWLGFGLNVAPLIMKSVIDAIVSQDYTIKSATSAYVDDIFINESLVPASRIQQHFLKYGLVSKDPMRLRDGARVLGLQVWKKDGTLQQKRGSQIPGIPDGLTRRCVFSLSGETCWSLPCMWMAQGSSCIYKVPGNCSKQRAGMIESKTLLSHIGRDFDQSMRSRSRWEKLVYGKEIAVWVDASSVAKRVALETNGTIIEDVC